jgi:hypothetical protein
MTAAATITPGIASSAPRASLSPKSLARIAGALYLLTILGGIVAQGFIGNRLIIETDAVQTAANIVAHTPLFRVAFGIYFVELLCQIAMTALLYDLLKPAGKTLSRLAAIFGIGGCIVKLIARLFFIAPLLVLDGAPWLSSFDPTQQKGIALLLLRVNDLGAAMAMVFFGVYAILKGWLILRSTFLPKWLGALAIAGGAGWLAFVSPPLGYRLFPIVAPLALLGSIATIAWLLIFGVDERRWLDQARVEAGSIWR